MTIKYGSLATSLKVPSRKYAGKMEGLCGDCNNNKKNDLTLNTGEITTDSEEFALNWLYTQIPGMVPEACKPPPACKELPPEDDPCRQILDYDTFHQVYFIFKFNLNFTIIFS